MLNNAKDKTSFNNPMIKFNRSSSWAKRGLKTQEANKELRSKFILQLKDYAIEAVANEKRSFIKDELCEALIRACIENGIDSRDGIIITVPEYNGYTHRHVAAFLDAKTGTDPEVDLWAKGADKRYSILKR